MAYFAIYYLTGLIILWLLGDVENAIDASTEAVKDSGQTIGPNWLASIATLAVAMATLIWPAFLVMACMEGRK